MNGLTNIKRITALCVIAIMLLIPCVYAENETTDAAADMYGARVEKLTALGLWPFEEKEAAAAVNRGEFAQLTAALLHMSEAEAPHCSFADVPEGVSYYHAVSVVKALGIINGQNEYQFAPERAITVPEAVKTVLCALGYGARAEKAGGYPNGYASVAAALKFAYRQGDLTWQEAAALVERACEVYVMRVISLAEPEGRILYSTESKETILSVYHDVTCAEGNVTDNGLSTLDGASDLMKNHVKIGGKVFAYEKDDIRKALGSTVTVYYQTNDSTSALLWWEYTNAAEPLALSYSDLNTESSDFTKTQVVYLEAEHTKKAKVSPRAVLVYNEIAYPAFTVADMKLDNGFLTLTDGDGDGIYDMIFVEDYKSFRIESKASDGLEICDAFGQSYRLNSYQTVEILNEYGRATTAAAFELNQVVSVFESKGQEYLKIRISVDKTTNVFKQTDTEHNRNRYTIGEKTFSASAYLQEQITNGHYRLPELIPGENYRAYLDFNGDIAAFDAMGAIESYAYFLAAKRTGGGLDDRVSVKLVLEDAQTAVLPAAKKLTINDAAAKAADILLLTELKNGSDWQPQLIKIKTNVKGEIKSLETASRKSTTDVFNSVGFDPYRFSLVYDETNTYYYTNGRNMVGTSGKQYTLGDNTVMFYIPPDGDPAYIKTYRGIKETFLPARSQLKGYDADSSYMLGALVFTDIPDTADTDNMEYASYLYIVKHVGTVADADGTQLKQLTAYSHSIEWKMVEYMPGIIGDDIKEGDILRLAVNADDKVKRCTKIISTEGGRPAPGAFNLNDLTRSRSAYNGSTSVAWGYPCGVSPYSLTLSTDEEGGSIIHVPFYSSMTTYITYHAERKTCSASTYNGYKDIPVTATLNSTTGKFDIADKNVMVLATTNSSGAYDVIIIRFGE